MFRKFRKTIAEFDRDSGEKFRNSHEGYKYNSAIVVPIRIKVSNMHQDLKRLCRDDDYFHVVGFYVLILKKLLMTKRIIISIVSL